MKIAQVNFVSQFLAPPFAKSEVLQESCLLAERVDFNAGTLSGLFDLLLTGIRKTAEFSPSCPPGLAIYEIHDTILGEDAFELNVRVVFNREEHIRRDLHSRVFDGLRAALYSAADFEKREFSETYSDDTEGGK